ncbi:MAG: hypothetical protein JWQ88_3042 [Rhodoferax sp.]|nr:hypothetical protein [Rhodoferax sp.]
MPPAHRVAAAQQAGTITLDARVHPLCLPNATAEAVATELKVELRKGAQSMTLTWPMQAAADFVHFAQWADLPKD